MTGLKQRIEKNSMYCVETKMIPMSIVLTELSKTIAEIEKLFEKCGIQGTPAADKVLKALDGRNL